MKTRGKIGAKIAGGALVGALNGLFGGGGGMVAVPLLERTGLPAAKAHATAIAAVLPATVLSGAVYVASSLVPLSVLLPAAVGAVGGGIVGAKLLGRLPARALDFLFGALMLAAGIRMLFL